MKSIITLLLLCFTTNIIPQGLATEVVVQKGHTEEILQVAIHPDGSSYATASQDKTVKIWDANTKLLITNIQGFSFHVSSVRYSPEGRYLILRGDIGTCMLLDTKTWEPIKKHYDSFFPVTQMTFGRNDNLFFFAVDKKVYAANTKTWKKEVVGASGKDVVLLDYNDETSSLTVQGRGSTPVESDVSAKVKLLNPDLSYTPAKPTCAISINSENDITISCGDKDIFIKNPAVAIPTSAIFTNNDSVIFIGNEFGQLVRWDITKNLIQRVSVSKGSISQVVSFGQNQVLFSTALSEIGILNTDDLTITKTWKTEHPITCITGLPAENIVIIGDKEGNVEFWNAESKSKVASENMNTSSKNVLPIISIALSEDGKNLSASNGKNLSLFNTKKRTLTSTIAKGKKPHQVIFKDNNLLFSRENYSVLEYNPKKEETIETYSDPSKYSSKSSAREEERLPIAYHQSSGLIVNGGEQWKILVWDTKNKKVLPKNTCHSNYLNSINFNAKGDKFITTSQDGSAVIWDINKTNHIARLVHSETNHIVVVADNYYQSSPKGSGLIGFKIGNQAIPFDQLDLVFNRPDKVLKELGSTDKTVIDLYHKAYLKRLEKNGLSESIISTNIELPTIAIEKETTNSTTVSYKVSAFSKRDKLSKLMVWNNGVPVYGTTGKSITPGLSVNESISIPLVVGENKIQVSVINEAGVESIRVTNFVTSNSAAQTKPNLYFVGFGVSKYKDKTRDLKYADKDIRDLASVFSEQAGRIYNKVIIDTATNQNVSTSSLEKAKANLSKANINDVIILMYAGHGLLDKNYDYFLATHDIDFMNPDKNGISFEQFEQLLDGVATQKKIMLLDACHSGEIDKESISGASNETDEIAEVAFRSGGENIVYWPDNSFDLMKEMFTDTRRGSGAHIISSSSGNEYSQESKSWDNGVFTYALKSGLDNGTADENANGKTSITELANFLKLHVEGLTNNTQSPTYRQQNLDLDFVIWEK